LIFTRLAGGFRAISNRSEVFGAIIALWLGTIVGALLAFLTQVALARTLGVAQFGVFSAALALVNLVAPLAGFGIAGFWLKVYGSEGLQARRWLPPSFRFLTVSTSLVIVAIYAWAWMGPHDDTAKWVLAILAIHVLGQAAVDLTSAKYQVEGRHLRLAAWQFSPHFFRFVGVVSLGLSVDRGNLMASHAAMVFSIVALVVVSFGARQMRQMILGRLALEGHRSLFEGCGDILGRPGIRDVVTASWPFGLAGVFYLVYFQSDIILVRYMVDEVSAGIYNVAFVVMIAIYLFPAVIYRKFLLPKLHRWAHHDRKKLHDVYAYGNVLMLVLGLVSMVLLWLIVPSVLPWLFGEEYRDAVLLLTVLSVAAPFRFLGASAGAILTTRDLVHVKVKIMGAAAALNVLMNVALIPMYGGLGAAVSTVITEALLTMTFHLKLKRQLADGELRL
jgi:O-antigen/teichoic acid export membrane protein